MRTRPRTTAEQLVDALEEHAGKDFALGYLVSIIDTALRDGRDMLGKQVASALDRYTEKKEEER